AGDLGDLAKIRNTAYTSKENSTQTVEAYHRLIEKLIDLSQDMVVVLVALLATGALTEAGEVAGWARPAGVLAGGVLVWRRAPFAVVVLGAAGTTAVLRAAGVA
ncbi:nitrate- and nitrite sensing domain-containing protein, partial [Streptomyces sp. G35A]